MPAACARERLTRLYGAAHFSYAPFESRVSHFARYPRDRNFFYGARSPTNNESRAEISRQAR
jgi:hypothetical protein